jgi:hypothetical protein
MGDVEDKYRERLPDLVIAGGGPALEFLLKHRAALFADASPAVVEFLQRA